MLLGTLAPTERASIERHVSVCVRCAGALRGLERAGSAYDQAFAALRSRRVRIAAGRARLAAATEPPTGLALALPARLLRLRLAEATLALSVLTLAVVGSLGVEPSRPTAPSPRPALSGPAVATPELTDSDLIRAARLKYLQTRDMVIRVPAGSRY
jgi:hypothetical protein